ncbi:transposase [Paraburkholderia caffeinilytica]|uniref:transposase n=1 Tax=Paraburkholderia caffeinilytica TaxID=1761016 RepID=UPI003DA0ADB6
MALYLDGIIVAAIGVDNAGKKHLMGLVSGSSENASVVGSVARVARSRLVHGLGVLVRDRRLKALRSAIEELVSERARVQRCRAHKLRDVLDRQQKECISQTAAVMKAAYKLSAKDGMTKLRTHAA